MITHKFIFADDAPTGGGAETPKKKKRRSVPESDIDLMDVAKAVSESWLENPTITLRWKTSNIFSHDVVAYADTLGVRLSTGSIRPAQSQTIKELNEKVDAAVTEVKVYIEKKYKKVNARAQFARFGIVKEQRAYVFSRDRNNRLAAFKLMIEAIAADGFGAEEFGTAFWTDLQAEYRTAVDASSGTTGKVSEKVATKNEQKEAIKKVLGSLLFVLRGNYPQTYPQVYRSWGWQKESY